jgi:hypothetical protein
MSTSCVCVQKFTGCLFKLSTLLFGIRAGSDREASVRPVEVEVG